MSVVWNASEHFYTFLSTDKTAGSATGISYTGAWAFETNTGKSYLVLPNLQLQEYAMPVNITGSAIPVNITGSAIPPSLASENHIGQTGGTGATISASFAGNGAAILHAANSFVAPLAGGLTELPNAFRTGISSAYLTDIGVSCAASGVVIVPRVHFYNGSSVTVAVDAGSYIELFADRALRQGYFTMAAMTSAAGSSTNCSRATTTDTTSNSTRPLFLVSPANNSTSLWYGIETRTAFTSTASMVWNVTVRMDQN